MKIIPALAIIFLTLLSLSAAAESTGKPAMHKLDYVISHNFDDEGGKIETKNSGVINFKWNDIEPYLSDNRQKLINFVTEGKKDNKPVWLKFSAENTLVSLWPAYKATSISISGSGSENHLNIIALPSPSIFKLEKSSPDFLRLKEIIDKNSTNTQIDVYLAAQPAGIIHDIIIVEKP